MWGQDEPQTPRYAITPNCSVGAEGGHERTERVYFAKGSAERPLGWNDVESKFLDCAAYSGVDPYTAGDVAKKLGNFAEIDDVALLVNRLHLRPQ
jgi:hypothetical protein